MAKEKVQKEREALAGFLAWATSTGNYQVTEAAKRYLAMLATVE